MKKFLGAMFTAALASSSFALFAPSAAAQPAPPALGGCELATPANTTLESNPHGAFLSTYVQYRCPAPAEIDLDSQIYRITPQGPQFIDLTSAQGVNEAPFLQYDTPYCDTNANSTYYTDYQLTINGESATFRTPTNLTVPCFLEGPPFES